MRKASSHSTPSRSSAVSARTVSDAMHPMSNRGAEINSAAGQRNTASLQYHFGSRLGLLQAIVDKHRPAMAERQQALWDAMLADGATDDPRRLLDVLVRPLSACLDEGESGRAWVKMCAELASRPQLPIEEMTAASTSAAREDGTALVAVLARDLPVDFAIARLLSVSQSTIHLMADRARLEDAQSVRKPTMSLALFEANLLDMACAALTAPMSSEARALL